MVDRNVATDHSSLITNIVATKKEIKRVTDAIVKHYKPEKIILFGSYAWGKPGKDSDLDLFIIKNSGKDPLKRAYEVRTRIDTDNAMDVLVFTPDEVEKRVQLGDFFINNILTKGKILYEKR